MKITSVFAREILDSRGNPTVEAELCGESELESGEKETKTKELPAFNRFISCPQESQTKRFMQQA